MNTVTVGPGQPLTPPVCEPTSAPPAWLTAIYTALYDAKLSLLGQLEYRGSFVIWALGDTIRSLISLAVWLAVRESSPRLPWIAGS